MMSTMFLVIWCAKLEGRGTVVVGWYKNATVYRYYEPIDLEWEDGQFFNAKARAEDCVLLPSASRYRAIWGVPRGRTSRYGFGQANVWFADEEDSNDVVLRVSANAMGIAKPDTEPGPCDEAHYVKVTGVPKGVSGAQVILLFSHTAKKLAEKRHRYEFEFSELCPVAMTGWGRL